MEDIQNKIKQKSTKTTKKQSNNQEAPTSVQFLTFILCVCGLPVIIKNFYPLAPKLIQILEQNNSFNENLYPTVFKNLDNLVYLKRYDNIWDMETRFQVFVQFSIYIGGYFLLLVSLKLLADLLIFIVKPQQSIKLIVKDFLRRNVLNTLEQSIIFVLILGYWANSVGEAADLIFVYSTVLLFLFSRVLFFAVYLISVKTGITTLRYLGFFLTIFCQIVMFMQCQGYKVFGNFITLK